ncbi:MAG: hypothetical protein AABO57_24300 [Acidobacteriota bacterium]
MKKTLLTLILSALGGWTATLAQTSGGIELTLIRNGALWKGDARIIAPGQQPSNVLRDLKVTRNQVTFTTNVLAIELRFRGKLTGDRLRGTVEGFQGSTQISRGTWVVTRQKPGPRGEVLAGRWSGTFDLQTSSPPGAQPGSDPAFDAKVAHRAYLADSPNVLFDEAHENTDTSAGRYKPFSDLITGDGYRVVPNGQRFSQSTLKGHQVLVIVNASGPRGRRDAAAFTEAECDAVRDWVDAGGALLLITDHAPFSAAATALAKRFGVELTIGHTFDTLHYNKESGDQTELLFSREDGLLGEHPITRGRDDTERINRIITFSGTSVKGPPESVLLLKLGSTAMDVLPPDRKPSSPDEPAPDHKTVSAAGRAQGLALEFGKGRVVILSEAAMLTAQVAPSGFRFGMNLSGNDNRQLALNVMHWLSGLLK